MPLNRQRAFTLLELMIALSLGGLILTGVLQLAGILKKILAQQEALICIQESMQTSVFILGKAVRTAGHMGCVKWQEVQHIQVPEKRLLIERGLTSRAAMVITNKAELKKQGWLSPSTLANMQPNSDILWIISSEPRSMDKPGDIFIESDGLQLSLSSEPTAQATRRLTSTLYYVSSSNNLYIKEFNRNATGQVEGVKHLRMQLTRQGVRIEFTFSHANHELPWSREWVIR